MGRGFWIERIERRRAADSEVESLLLEQGLNVIVGEPNTGKSGWLRFIDYGLGDTDSPEKSLGSVLAEKYDRVSLTLRIGTETVLIDRGWGQGAVRSHVDVDGERIRVQVFSRYLLDRLEVPRVRFPLGNPYEEKRWREISWRMMLRHLYRREDAWTDFADQQPEAEQAASVLQLLGLAERAFPTQILEQIERRRDRATLDGRIAQLRELVEELAGELVDWPKGTDALVADAVIRARQELERSLDELSSRRDSLARGSAVALTEDDGYQAAASAWQGAVDALNLLETQVRQLDGRVSELTEYRDAVRREHQRIVDAKSAVDLLGSLRVTHCPACDQAVERDRGRDDDCYLCLRPLPGSEPPRPGANEARLGFEIAQVESETVELDQLIGELQRERRTASQILSRRHAETAQAEARLRPFTSEAGALSDPRVVSFDREIGFLQARLQGLDRLSSLAETVDRLTVERDELSAVIEGASDERSGLSDELSEFESRLSNSMNQYLRLLNGAEERRWTQPPVQIDLDERRVRAYVGSGSWKSELGGTLRCYFLLAYHFALIGTSGSSNHPGFTILDFPPELLEGPDIGASQNFVLEPFLAVVNRPDQLGRQIIAAGRAFAAFPGAHRVILETVWTQSDAP